LFALCAGSSNGKRALATPFSGETFESSPPSSFGRRVSLTLLPLRTEERPRADQGTSPTPSQQHQTFQPGRAFVCLPLTKAVLLAPTPFISLVADSFSSSIPSANRDSQISAMPVSVGTPLWVSWIGARFHPMPRLFSRNPLLGGCDRTPDSLLQRCALMAHFLASNGPSGLPFHIFPLSTFSEAPSVTAPRYYFHRWSEPGEFDFFFSVSFSFLAFLPSTVRDSDRGQAPVDCGLDFLS